MSRQPHPRIDALEGACHTLCHADDPALRERVEGILSRILAAQASREERLAIADDLIDNSSDLDSLRARVDELDVSYRSLARQRDRRAPRPGSA